MVMSFQMMGGVASHLAKRQSKLPSIKPSAWTFVIIISVIIIFLPVLIYISYTLTQVYTTLAMIENPSPASYDAVATEDNDAIPVVPTNTEEGDIETAADKPPQPVTASLRRTNRVLYAAGGWRANLRGLVPAIVLSVSGMVVGGIVGSIPFVPGPLGILVTMLALVQLNTAWVHAVIRSNPSGPAMAFWRNMPPFRRTFRASALPVAILWLASTIAIYVPSLLSAAFGIPAIGETDDNGEVPKFPPGVGWKLSVVGTSAIVAYILFVIPAKVVYVRVQASLLPPEDDTLVPFDRSFAGTVEPLVVGGPGYVTCLNAVRTISRGSWARLCLLYVKIFAIDILVQTLFVACLLLSLFTIKIVPPTDPEI